MTAHDSMVCENRTETLTVVLAQSKLEESLSSVLCWNSLLEPGRLEKGVIWGGPSYLLGHSRTTPYHQQSNPAERFNRMLLSMLHKLEETQKSNWKDYLNKVVHAYNSTVHESTGFSPFFLLFGMEPTLPIDLMFPNEEEKNRTSQVGYAEKWQKSMQEAYDIAGKNMSKSAKRGQRHYNQRVWSSVLEPGDHVLIRNLSERGGPGKIRAYWESKVHVVKEREGTDLREGFTQKPSATLPLPP
ncbi:uncharacterized protein LOC122984617 [Thunnus albacares]|uniref:uncharacterized protein LOC122984617 n=1 Tax=Thunnus albacares TaxID=8236 RepID=UPI001CF659C0|nr:uncharacterized protein LOC122984617 [Thunnus albacares]